MADAVIPNEGPQPQGVILSGTLPDWPMFGLADDVRPALAEADAAGKSIALATLYAVIGGSPRAPGSQMAISEDRLTGFLSGGCIEADIAAHAAGVLQDLKPRRLIYGEGGPFPDIRLLCGGRVEILLEAIKPGDEAVRRLLALMQVRRPALWVSDGVQRACWDAEDVPPSLDDALGEAAVRLQAEPLAACVTEGEAVGLRRLPVRRMIVVGGDPTAIAIASLSSQSGFETWLVRPKGPEAPPPLSDVRYDRRAPEAALPSIGLDAWTHVAVATHDLESDEQALTAALASPAHVGVLGARRRMPERLARLRTLGVDEAALKRLKAPIGLDLGGKAPFEIAVAVVAEAIAQGRAA